MSTGRIRSGYRRRLLDWLADGGGTVSQAANELGIRMPHVSAELKRLRNEGLVVRADESGNRGAVHFLTTKGWRALESDALDRLDTLIDWPPPPGAKGIVLAKDGGSLLLALVQNPESSLLSLPGNPLATEENRGYFSTGNDGGAIWAVVMRPGIRWYDLHERTPSNPPSDATSTLEDWLEQDLVGLVRARMLDSNKVWPLSPGTWFGSVTDSGVPELPIEFTDGPVIIGRAGSINGPEVSPSKQLVAVGLSDIVASSIVDLYPNCLRIISTGVARGMSSPLPVGILNHWLRRKHPRSEEKNIQSRFKRLSRRVLKDPVSVRGETGRAILGDFGGREWVADSPGTLIDTTGMTEEGVRSVIEWALNETELDLVIQWRWSGDNRIISRLRYEERLRLLLCPEFVSEGLCLRQGDSGSELILETAEGTRLPLILGKVRESKSRSIPKDWFPPEQPTDLQKQVHSVSMGPPSDGRDALWIASGLYPEGDENWANSVEMKYPLASWIASPGENRIGRWIRVKDRIESNWIGLLTPSSLTLEELIETTSSGDEKWREDSVEALMDHLRKIPTSLARLNSDDPVSAAAIIRVADWVEVPQEMLDLALKTFCESPCSVQGVINCLESVGKRQWRAELRRSNDARLIAWKELESDDSIPAARQRELILDLPILWWADRAESWLRNQLSNSTGRAFLSRTDIPWPVMIIRPKGELVGPPGSRKPHPGAPTTHLEDLRLIHHLDAGFGKDSLMDLLDALESATNNTPPKPGRTHLLVGWLGWDSEKRPSFSDEELFAGNAQITRILARDS